jgi:hypothetical protein
LRLYRLAYRNGSLVLGERWLNLFLLVCIVGVPTAWAAGCSETPTVLMDERTAETHLLSKKDPVLPAQVPKLALLRKVNLLVTVDREGTICEVRAVAGPKELRGVAIRTVRKHWRYRPFLVDWKRVVARFPVSVRFVLPQAEPRLTACLEGATLEAGPGKAV